jgi:hypothetical protein
MEICTLKIALSRKKSKKIDSGGKIIGMGEKPAFSRQALSKRRGGSDSRIAERRAEEEVRGHATAGTRRVRTGTTWYQGADRDHVVQSGRGASLRKANPGSSWRTEAAAEEGQQSRELQEKGRTQRWKLWRR